MLLRAVVLTVPVWSGQYMLSRRRSAVDTPAGPAYTPAAKESSIPGLLDRRERVSLPAARKPRSPAYRPGCRISVQIGLMYRCWPESAPSRHERETLWPSGQTIGTLTSDCRRATDSENGSAEQRGVHYVEN